MLHDKTNKIIEEFKSIINFYQPTIIYIEKVTRGSNRIAISSRNTFSRQISVVINCEIRTGS